MNHVVTPIRPIEGPAPRAAAAAPAQPDRAGMEEIFADFRLRDRWKPNYRARDVGDGVFLSSDQGSWALLSRDEYRALRSIALPRALHDLLEERGLILTARNADSVMRAYEDWSANYFPGTALHIIGMTRRCNLRCAYCHAAVVRDSSDPARYDLDEATARAIVDFAYQSPSSRIHFEFQGGEATLNFGAVRYLHAYAMIKNLAHKRALSFSIVSNGVELPDEVLDYLAASRINITTSIEFDAAEHPSLRVDWDGRGHWDDIRRNRARMRERGLDVPSLIVVGRNNLHKLRDYVDFAVAEGQSSIFFSPVQKMGFAKGKWDNVGMEMDEFFDAWRDALDYIFSLWDQGILLEERYFSLALEKLFNNRDVKYVDFRNPSGMVLGNLAYDHLGNVYGCDEGRGHADFRIGNVHTDSYAAAVTSDKARQLVSYSLREHDACQVCAYRPYCGVSPIVSKGETHSLDPQPLTSSCCQRTRHLFDFVVKLMRERPQRVDQALTIIRMSTQ
ncbi:MULTISPECIES: radical SAM/SPASM domain-containing protein [Chromobacterium]|uniref:Radical SAM protein n=4 Tax=Chromobacterium TaxID=535 RepID=A0ABS3GK38_9NEIS|nr:MULTISPECIES: radical SAM protein [Chromobacterium]AXT45801.1 radical SAM protein [Chromobacterium rhizoryzae]MBK0413904.1 radical SAM protein [Chromobacterium haemolyticum]MBO0415409.1 radical SAM protein [Chromobacterium haemolyticum]MBO0498670.1 radical SAM protein [Chromobacterium haemolyticum]MDH0340744.1 radical SAM protein [Chromobacterium haemolyticum]